MTSGSSGRPNCHRSMSSLLAELRREREARHGPPPSTDSLEPPPPAPTEQVLEPTPPTARGAEPPPPAPRGAEPTGPTPRSAEPPPSAAHGVEPPPKRARSAGPASYVGGALKDSGGSHSLRPPTVPADAVEIDCRRSGTEIKQRGNIATLAAGLGSLHDRKPTNDREKQHVLDFLNRDADHIDRELTRGQSVWVHCGFNRGPSGVLAYLLQYTDATWDQACGAVRAARRRARTHHNTFEAELQELALQPKKKHAPFSRVVILDGGNDPADDKRPPTTRPA